LLVGVVGIAILLTGVLVAAWVTAPAPARPKQIVLGRLRAVGGRFVPLREVSPVLQRAIVATEDERFYRHHGIDLMVSPEHSPMTRATSRCHRAAAP
jgi:membrane peptidoglycan carboxypeptidase